MDSRWLPVLLGAGWGLVTWGLWGACGRPWWLWPLSTGLACLSVGGVYACAAWFQIKARARAHDTSGPEEPTRRNFP